MNTILIILFSWLLISESEIKQIRTLYNEAAFNKSKNLELIEFIEKKNDDSPCMLAYKGCAIALMAKHIVNPLKKFNYFNEGTKILELAIAKETADPELRYLRFTIQTNAPKFLGYNKKIDEDKLFLLHSIKNIDDGELKNSIVSFLIKSSYLSQTEKKML